MPGIDKIAFLGYCLGMKKSFLKLAAFLAIAALALPLPIQAENNRIFLRLDKTSYFLPEISFELAVSEPSPVLALDVTIEFDPEFLSLASSSLLHDIGEIVAIREIDNTAGRCRLVCGRTKSLDSLSEFVRLDFKKIKKGKTKIIIKDIFAADAENPGKNIISGGEIHYLEII